uniref:F-box domain-containing protein n=1 Tax=Moniliophthora roreri TaxID=221103 RepID=A0A0W0FCM2_MONRR
MDLSFELWEDIVGRCTIPDWVEIARVFSAFREIATRRPYEALVLYCGERNTIRCLRTLYSNALAAQPVKTLYLWDHSDAPYLKAFSSLAIRALSALRNLQSLRYRYSYSPTDGTLKPSEKAQMILNYTFPRLERLSIPNFLGSALLKRHQKTLRKVVPLSEILIDLDVQMFDQGFNFPVLEEINLSNNILPSFLSKSHLPSLRSICLPDKISADDLEHIKSFFSRSGSQMAEFKLGFSMPIQDTRVIDMIADKLPHLGSLEIYCSYSQGLDFVLETVRWIIPKLGRLEQLQNFRWDEQQLRGCSIWLAKEVKNVVMINFTHVSLVLGHSVLHYEHAR